MLFLWEVAATMRKGRKYNEHGTTEKERTLAQSVRMSKRIKALYNQKQKISVVNRSQPKVEVWKR